MKKGRITRAMFDLDGCVGNTYQDAMIRELKKQFGVTIDFNELTDVKFARHPDITSEMLIEIFRKKNFYDSLEVYDGAIEGMRELRGNGIEVVICTVRPNNDEVRNDTIHWFYTHSIPFDTFHILPRRATHETNGKAKARITQASKCQAFFEDDPIYSEYLAKVCKKGFVISQPYNVNLDFPKNVTIVNNIPEGVKAILDYNKQ